MSWFTTPRLRRFFYLVLLMLFSGGAWLAFATPPTAAQSTWRSPLIGDGSAFARGEMAESPLFNEAVAAADARMEMNPDLLAPWVAMTWQSARDGDYDIYYTKGDSGTVVQLTNFPSAEGSPRLKPGGGEVLYVRDNQLWIATTDGANTIPLTTSGVHSRPTWSGDGNFIYYASDVSGNAEIWRINADGTNPVQITNSPLPDVYPVVSPDGNWLAWIEVQDETYGRINVRHLTTGQSVSSGVCPYLASIAWTANTGGLYASCDATGDFWYDIAYVQLPGSGNFNVITAGEFLNDRVIGSHVGEYRLAGDFFYNGYYYRIVGNQLELDRILLQRYTAATGGIVSVFESGADVNPDAISLDTTAPTVTMEPMPSLSRAFSPLSVRWRGTDSGGSGIESYDVLHRTSGSPEFVPLATATTATSLFCCGYPAGTDAEFVANGVDVAGNRSATSASVSTHYYAFRETLRATDNRGYGMPNATGASGRVTTAGQNGERIAYRDANGAPFTMALPGYTVTASAPLSTTQDRIFPVYGIPASTPNLLTNGGFDGSLNGWQAVGNPSAIVVDENRHSGRHALRLGPPCNDACLNQSTFPDFSGNYLSTAAAQDGTIHFFWLESQAIRYRHLKPDGTYSAIEEFGASSRRLPQAAVDAWGTLHVLHHSQEEIFYRQRSASGTWSASTSLGALPDYDLLPLNGVYHLAPDPQGRVHVLYRACESDCSNTDRIRLFYRQRSAAGQWSARETLGDYAKLSGDSVAVQADGTVHVLYMEGEETNASALIHAIRQPNGTWRSATPPFYRDTSFHESRVYSMVVAPDKRVHIVTNEDAFSLQYMVYDPASDQWEFWLNEDRPYAAELTIDPAGNLYLARAVTVEGFNRVSLTRIRPDGRWDEPTLTTATNGGPTALMYDTVRGLTMVAGYTDILTGFTSAGADRGVRQTVTIPADMPNPTLTFYYDLHHTLRDKPSQFTVTVTDGSTSTIVYSDSAAAGWTLGWADLSAWAGEAVTVTFALETPEGVPASYLLLDSVSLTSWQTPVITTVSPTQVSVPYGSTTITLTGMNFTAPLSVKVGSQTATITRIDDQTATLTLPAGLPLGRHPIDLTNGAGLTYRRLAAITIGARLYLTTVNGN